MRHSQLLLHRCQALFEAGIVPRQVADLLLVLGHGHRAVAPGACRAYAPGSEGAMGKIRSSTDRHWQAICFHQTESLLPLCHGQGTRKRAPSPPRKHIMTLAQGGMPPACRVRQTRSRLARHDGTSFMRHACRCRVYLYAPALASAAATLAATADARTCSPLSTEASCSSSAWRLSMTWPGSRQAPGRRHIPGGRSWAGAVHETGAVCYM